MTVPLTTPTFWPKHWKTAGAAPGIDPAFKDLNGVLQGRYQKLHESGVGAVIKHATCSSYIIVEKDALWYLKVIGGHDPLAFQTAIYF